MTAPDVETVLRDALAAHTDGLRPDPGFVRDTLDHSDAALRKARRRQLALGAGVAAAAVALAVWQAPPLADRADTPPTRQGQTADDGSAAMRWAQSLPRGADADVAYVTGDTLVAGASRTILVDGGDYTLLGALPGGWFADLWQPASGPYISPDTFGYLSADGRFRPYRAPAIGRLGVSGAAVSPDGSEVAYQGVVVLTGVDRTGSFEPSVAGSVVAALPANARVIVDFTESGVVYRDRDGHLWHTSSTGPPVREPVDEYVPIGFGFARSGGCLQAIEQPSPEPVRPGLRMCDVGVPITVSRSGFALMPSGEIVNLDEDVSYLSLPAAVDAAQLQPFWESDDGLILVAHRTDGAGATSALLVRCVVSTGLCEQASDVLTSYPQLSALPD